MTPVPTPTPTGATATWLVGDVFDRMDEGSLFDGGAA